MTSDDVRRIAPALTPIAATWLKRTEEIWVIDLGNTVGRHLPEWPELVGMLEELIRTGSDDGAAAAMDLIVDRVPDDRERIILAALARDPTWAYQRSVLDFLHLQRQDLLTPYLGRQFFSGRFSTGQAWYVLPLDSGFARWTDAQQETFADSLADLARPPAYENAAQLTFNVIPAVRRLAALPAIGPDRLIALARDGRAVVQETAVRALGRLDARDGIPELLDALADGRARWAVYALRQALHDLAPGRVLAVVQGVPLTKVTVAKEAVRLAGELGGSGAIPWLLEVHRRDLHRDVRGALLRGLWDHLDRPEAWTILDESAASQDRGVVIGLARIPVDRASAEARERVAGLLLRLLDHPEPTVRLAVLDRMAAQPVIDADRRLRDALLARLASPLRDERTRGLNAALAGATDADAPAFAAAFARLLPHRRELSEAVQLCVMKFRPDDPRLRAVGSAVLSALAADPALTSLQVRLAAAALTAESFGRWVLDLADSPRWHVATQTEVFDAVSQACPPADDQDRIEALWAASPDPTVRWMALRVLHLAAEVQGWTDDRRERLRRHQADPSPIVADEAALLFPPDPQS